MSMSPAVYADASFFIALFTAKDEFHARASAWQQHLARAGTHIVTTEAALWEWLNFSATPAARVPAAVAYRQLHADASVEVIEFSDALCESAVNLYAQRKDKSWGVTDCLSFVVMRQKRLVDALTADHHFEQAGFAALLLHEPPP
ncbi:MAG: PIN domain-containing protein [Tepidisphaeraceae bacterium]